MPNNLISPQELAAMGFRLAPSAPSASSDLISPQELASMGFRLAPSQPSFNDKLQHGAKQIRSGLIEGAAQLGALPFDLTGMALKAAIPPLRGSNIDSAGTQAVQALRQLGVTETEQPKTLLGRMGRTGAEFVGGNIVPLGALARVKDANRLTKALTAAPGMQLLSSMTAGGGTELAKEATDNPYAIAGAGLVAGLTPYGVQAAGRQVGNLVRPLTPAGQKTIAAQVIKEVTGDVPLRTLDVVPSDPLARFKTPAELTQSPLAAQFEKGIGRAIPEAGEVATRRIAEREAARRSLVEALVPDPAVISMEAGARGEGIRQALAPDASTAKAAASRLYESVDPAGATRIPLAKAADDVAARMVEIFPEGTAQPSAATRQIVDNLKKAAETEQPWKVVQALAKNAGRARAGLMRSADAVGDDPALLAVIKTKVLEAADDAVRTGGFTADQAETFLQARQAWKAYEETFRSGAVGRVLKPSGYGGFTTLDSDIGSILWRKPEGIKQFLEAAKNRPDAVNLLKGHAIEELVKRNQGTWPKYLTQHREKYRTLFGDRHYGQLKQVVKDITSQQSVDKLAWAPSRGQSATAQVNTAMHIKEKLTGNVELLGRLLKGRGAVGGAIAGGGLGGNLATALGGAAIGRMAETTAANASAAVNKMLIEAAFDPRTAKTLLAAPTPQRVDSVLRTLTTQGARIGALESALMGDIQPGQADIADDWSRLTMAPGSIVGEDITVELAPTEEPMQKAKPLPKSPAEIDVTEDPLIKAIVWTESRGNPSAVSPVGAEGLMQLMPATGKERFERLKKAGVVEGTYDPYDEAQNVIIGTDYIQELTDRFGSLELGLAAYNWGQGNVRKALKKHGNSWDSIRTKAPKETRDYVAKVLATMETLTTANTGVS